MAEDLDQQTKERLSETEERLSNSELLDDDVQSLMARVSKAVSIGGSLANSTVVTGDNNQINNQYTTINQGTDSDELLDKINRITAENQDANRIQLLDKLNRTIDEVEAAHQRPIRCETRTMLITSVSIAALVGIARFLAGLQGLELWALDGLMSVQQLSSRIDDRILVIAPDDEEVEQQGQETRDRGVSMTDDKLADVLKKVQKVYHPIVIGLDLQRDFKAKPELAQLLNPNSISKPAVPLLIQQTKSVVKKGTLKKGVAKSNKTTPYKNGSKTTSQLPVVKASAQPNILNLFGGCKALETEEGSNGTQPKAGTEVAPPPEIPIEKIGFTDFVTGVGNRGVSRRQILAQDPPEGSKSCITKLAFSTQIASQFLLKKQDYKPQANPSEENCLRFSKPNAQSSFSFPFLKPVFGGFQGGEDWSSGCQMILNYGTKKIKTIRLKDLDKATQNQSNPPVAQSSLPEIILIGSAAHTHHDMWLTPLGEMDGVTIQALTASQIIDIVLGKQRLIWALPEWTDFLWVLSWSLLGGVLGWRLRFWKPWSLSLSTAVIVLYVGCGLSFWLLRLWLPLIPSLITVLASASSVAYLNFRRKFGTNNPFQILRAALMESK